MLERGPPAPYAGAMSRTARVRKTRFGGYHRTPSAGPDETLTRVGRGTPCGEYMRRFWHPVALSDELRDLPVAVRILGEDLVLFRDGRGRVGLLDRYCSHRNTSLEYAKVCETGIRCCYHGWQYDIDGRVLDTPGEPAESRLKDRFFHGAYPIREYQGLVFAYMGPPEKIPAFPVFDALEHAEATYVHRKRHSPCNWLQIRENEMDPVHITFLHTRLFGVQFVPVYGALPVMEWQETTHGMIYLTTRRWGDFLYLRTNDMILPNIARIAGIEDAGGETLFDRRGSSLSWTVPIDDTNSMNIGFGDIDKNLVLADGEAYTDRQSRAGAYAVGAGDVGQTGAPSYAERQRAPGDWDAWTSQGAITDHGRERLGSTDEGVALYRRLLSRDIAAVARGREPKGMRQPESGPVPTYCHNTVMRVPRAQSEEDEGALSRAFGRAVSRRILAGEIRKDTLGAASAETRREFRFTPET